MAFSRVCRIAAVVAPMPVLAAMLAACFASAGRESDNAEDLQTVEIVSLSKKTAHHKAPETPVAARTEIPDVAMKVNDRGVVVGAWKGGDRATDRLAIACYEEILRLLGRPSPSKTPPICGFVKFKRYLVR